MGKVDHLAVGEACKAKYTLTSSWFKDTIFDRGLCTEHRNKSPNSERSMCGLLQVKKKKKWPSLALDAQEQRVDLNFCIRGIQSWSAEEENHGYSNNNNNNNNNNNHNLVNKLVGALSPVNHRGLHQG